MIMPNDRVVTEFFITSNGFCQSQPGHWLLIDVNQARYEIMDVGALDRKSQRLTSRYLYL